MLDKFSFQELTPEQESPLFSITIDVLDSLGQPTGKKKTYSSDRAKDIYSFWFRNRGHGRKRKKSQVASKIEAEKIVEKMYKEEAKQQGSENINNDHSNS